MVEDFSLAGGILITFDVRILSRKSCRYKKVYSGKSLSLSLSLAALKVGHLINYTAVLLCIFTMREVNEGHEPPQETRTRKKCKAREERKRYK